MPQIKSTTKIIISILTAVGSVSQIPQVKALATAFLTTHPGLAIIVAMVTGIGLALHNPTPTTPAQS